MIETFDQCFETVIGHEGGYTDHPKDPGNWTGGKVGVGSLKGTKYGIAANTYPNEDIKGMTLERAKQIYKSDFWLKLRCEDLPAVLRYPMFDAGVNSGVPQASKWLQQAVDVKVDGVIGNITLAAVSSYPAERIRQRLLGKRLRLMTDLTTWPSFGRGWARRIASLLES